MSTAPYLLEAVVDSLESALAAEAAGAHRVELCCALELGGLTPSFGMTEIVSARLNIPVQVLLRPRPGNFVYSESELKVMKMNASLIALTGAAGIVTGTLNEAGELATEPLKQLIGASKGLPLTFHRAFDHVKDPFQTAQQLVELGLERILSSGQKASAMEGAELLRDLQREFGAKIVIMPGGGISAENVREIATTTGCRELHFSALRAFVGKTNGPEVGKGGMGMQHFVPDPDKVKAIRMALDEQAG